MCVFAVVLLLYYAYVYLVSPGPAARVDVAAAHDGPGGSGNCLSARDGGAGLVRATDALGGSCSLCPAHMFVAQMHFVVQAHVNVPAVAHVAVFGCETRGLMAAAGVWDNVSVVYARQGYDCGDAGEPGDPVAGSDLAQWFRELRGVVPHVALFPSGVNALLASGTLVHTLAGIVNLPDFRTHMVVFDVFSARGCTVSPVCAALHDKDSFVREVVYAFSTSTSRVAVQYAHNLTGVSVANIALRRQVDEFTRDHYGLRIHNGCDERLLEHVQRGNIEYWFIVFNKTAV